MKKYLFITCGLALMVSAATVLAGCSSDDDDLLSNPAVLSQNELGNWINLKEGEKMAECPFLPNDEHYYTISFNKEQHFKAILACYYFEGRVCCRQCQHPVKGKLTRVKHGNGYVRIISLSTGNLTTF